MKNSWLGLGLIAAMSAVVGCRNSSPQVDQTQTTGAPAPNANDNGNGSGDHSGSANPQGQQATIQGNAPSGAVMEDNDKGSRPAVGYQNLGKADAGH